MSVQQIKDEIQSMKLTEIQEIASFALRVRRERDPDRKSQITLLLDSPNKKWVTLDEFEQRTES